MQKIQKDFVGRIHGSITVPLFLLGLSLMFVFLFQNDRHSFQPGHHGFLSSHGMTISTNLSPEHHFLMFNFQYQNMAGDLRYQPYTRFPIGAFAAIRIFTAPFHRDLSMQISVARNLMNCFFIAAACFAYLSLFRLFGAGWVAASATLLSFSSYYCLYYNDMIFQDVPTLFGILMVFHGMVIFIQEGRFYQLLIKSCVALLFGWQVYGLLLPFTLIGCTGELLEHRSVRSLLCSQFFILGVILTLFGAAVLGVNLTLEKLAVGGEFQNLPTFRQMLWRVGLAAPEVYKQHAASLAWPAFIKNQLYHIGRMSLPDYFVHFWRSPRFIPFGIVVFITCLAVSFLSRNRVLVFSLCVSGLCWALPMRRYVAFHDYQSLYYIGLPLFFYSIFCLMAKRFSRRASIVICFAAALIFIQSSLRLNLVKSKNNATENNLLTADFQRIRDKTGVRRRVLIDGKHGYGTIGGGFHAVGFYLSGSFFLFKALGSENADFVVSKYRNAALKTLTPKNQKVFLYQGGEWRRFWNDRKNAEIPPTPAIARSSSIINKIGVPLNLARRLKI